MASDKTDASSETQRSATIEAQRAIQRKVDAKDKDKSKKDVKSEPIHRRGG